MSRIIFSKIYKCAASLQIMFHMRYNALSVNQNYSVIAYVLEYFSEFHMLRQWKREILWVYKLLYMLSGNTDNASIGNIGVCNTIIPLSIIKSTVVKNKICKLPYISNVLCNYHKAIGSILINRQENCRAL